MTRDPLIAAPGPSEVPGIRGAHGPYRGSAASCPFRPNTVTLRWHVRSWTLFARSRPSDNATLVSRSESHAAWSPPGLKGGVLPTRPILGRLRKSFGCLTALCAVKQKLDFETGPWDAGYDHSAWRTLLPPR